jgi:flavin-binding protein dodecin
VFAIKPFLVARRRYSRSIPCFALGETVCQSPAQQGRAVGITRQISGTIHSRNQRRTLMTQKIIDVVGTSTESFAKAAENAVAEAAKTVRGLKWARVAQLEMELDGKKIAQYRATTKVYFDIEQ